MDKELIKMCDCPEIQDKWEPKVGDRVYGNAIVIKVYDCGPLKGSLDISENGIIERVHKANAIYIPRIEDVLEWLVPKHFNNWGNAFSYIANFPLIIDADAIYSAIKVYMHLEHNKTWNGGAWV